MTPAEAAVRLREIESDLRVVQESLGPGLLAHRPSGIPIGRRLTAIRAEINAMAEALPGLARYLER